jgi:hypothetical protein
MGGFNRLGQRSRVSWGSHFRDKEIQPLSKANRTLVERATPGTLLLMSWKSAVNKLAETAAKWTPAGLQPILRDTAWGPGVKMLELSKDEKRLYLEPAQWAQGKIPTSVDFWSARGPRVRLVGPDKKGNWKVLTADLIDMHKDWNSSTFESLCHDLLAV